MSGDGALGAMQALVDEWVRAGCTDAVLAPGSRSTPLALALAGAAAIRLHVVVDERTAGFFALGLARRSGRAVVVGCTSGTAAANLHPAVLEAFHARVPLVLCTADRPPELRDVGAGQTVDQQHLYGGAVRWYVEPEAPGEGGDVTAARWRGLGARAWIEAAGPPPGPVHLNLPFREPLVPERVPVPTPGGRPGGAPWVRVRRAPRVLPARELEELAARITRCERGLLVAGWGSRARAGSVERFARAAGWPILADPLSGARSGPHAVATYDALLRVDAFARAMRPDLVLRVGAPLTSKAATRWLDPAVPQVVVDPDRSWLDPRRAVAEVLEVDDEPLLDALATCLVTRAAGGNGSRGAAPSPWLDEWQRADALARQALDRTLEGFETPFDGRVARDLCASLPDGSTLVVASSMAVRDVESFAAPRRGLDIVANRGVNGIDGFVATTLGVAAARRDAAPPVALLGDLCFLDDAGSLALARREGLRATFVVLDNDGGGIFSLLPPAALDVPFDELFGTPQGADLPAIAEAHGATVRVVARPGDLGPAVAGARGERGVSVVRVPSDRATNAERHQAAWAAVAAAIAPAPVTVGPPAR